MKGLACSVARAYSGPPNPFHYEIQQWASILTSVPRCHGSASSRLLIHQRPFATAVKHERMTRRTRLTPRASFQATNPTTWIISSGSVSADKEAIALAKGLSLPWAMKRVQWRPSLAWLPTPFKKLIMDYHHVVNRKQTKKLPWFLQGDTLSEPFPSYVIGAGPNAVPGLLHTSRMSGKSSFSAYIHFPNLPFVHFDQVFLQKHEVVVQLGGLGIMKDQKNYFRINSTLNTITPKLLEQAKIYAQEHSLIPKSFFHRSPSAPIVTVLIGGPNDDCSHNTERMMTRLARILEVQNCRVLLTFSQRTADNTRQAVSKLQERIQDPDRLFVYDPMTVKKGSSTPNDQDSTMSNTNSELSAPGPKDLLGFRRGNNPYEAMLALADKIVVTADSVAMTSEALAAGKPVYILGGGLARGKLKVFHRYLADAHYTRAFRPGRIPIEQEERDTGADSSENGMETSDPLSYPGNLLPWNRSLAGQSPAETMKLVERLQILREARVTGHRAPEHITNATC